MSNILKFRNHLQEIDLHMEEINEDGGGVFFRTRQSFDNGGSVVIVASFNEKQTIVDLQIFDIAHITNPLKKDAVYQLLNDLNGGYRFSKFLEYEGKITAQYSYLISEENFNPAVIMDILIMLVETAEESYPKFMKIQWA